MARKKDTPRESKRWWETMGGLAGALVTTGGLLGAVYQFILPHRAVTISVIESSWNKLGPQEQRTERWVLLDASNWTWKELGNLPPRFRYEFDIEVRNTGNRPVAMTKMGRKQVYVCANVLRRPGVKPPSIELVTQTSDKEGVQVDSMLNNQLQMNIRDLPILGRAVVHVTLLSPIEDLGGVVLVSDDPVIVVEPRGSPPNPNNESLLSNNLLPVGPAPVAPPLKKDQ